MLCASIYLLDGNLVYVTCNAAAVARCVTMHETGLVGSNCVDFARDLVAFAREEPILFLAVFTLLVGRIVDFLVRDGFVKAH